MPVHSVPISQDPDRDTLAELVAQIEAEGETVVTFSAQGGRWVVLTSPKARREIRRQP